MLIPGYVAMALASLAPNLSAAVGSLAGGAADLLSRVVESLQSNVVAVAGFENRLRVGALDDLDLPVPVRWPDTPGQTHHDQFHESTEIPGIGHFLMLEKPDEFNRAFHAHIKS